MFHKKFQETFKRSLLLPQASFIFDAKSAGMGRLFYSVKPQPSSNAPTGQKQRATRFAGCSYVNRNGRHPPPTMQSMKAGILPCIYQLYICLKQLSLSAVQIFRTHSVLLNQYGIHSAENHKAYSPVFETPAHRSCRASQATPKPARIPMGIFVSALPSAHMHTPSPDPASPDRTERKIFPSQTAGRNADPQSTWITNIGTKHKCARAA